MLLKDLHSVKSLRRSAYVARPRLMLLRSLKRYLKIKEIKPDELLIEAPGPILFEKQKLEKMGYQLKVTDVLVK